MNGINLIIKVKSISPVCCDKVIIRKAKDIRKQKRKGKVRQLKPLSDVQNDILICLNVRLKINKEVEVVH